MQEQNMKKPEENNKIEEEEEEIDELTRYRNYVKKNKFPCYQNLLNPNNPTDYIPPTFILDKPKSEKEQEKIPTEKNEEYDYNDFEDNFNNKDENILKIQNNNIINNEFPLMNNIINNEFPLNDNIIKEDIKGENSNSQNNIQITESKKDNNIEEDYEKENFDYKLDNNNNENKNNDLNSKHNTEIKENKNDDLNGKENNEINENKNENVSNGAINENNNGDLKMLTDIIQDDKHPKYERIINPYYQTNYLPPDIFIKPNEPELEKSSHFENKYIESQMNVSELTKNNDTNEVNKNNSNLPILKEKIINNENPILENMIDNNFSNNIKDNFNFRNDNREEIKEENNKIIKNDNGGNKEIYNQFEVDMGNNFVSVENMIKVNQNIQNNNIENKKDDDKKEEEDEYNDFEVDN